MNSVAANESFGIAVHGGAGVMQNQGSTSISSSALHSFTSGPSGDDYEEQANAERQAYEEPAADPHDLRGLRGP